MNGMNTEVEELTVLNQTRRVSTEPKRNASSNSNEDQSNKKCRTDDQENEDGNIENIITIKVEDKQGEYEEKNDQLPLISLKELQDICYNELNNDSWKNVREAIIKLDVYSRDKQNGHNGGVRAATFSKDICKNHMIPCITFAICRFMHKVAVVQSGLDLLTSITFQIINDSLTAESAKVDDSITAESAMAIMNLAVLSMKKHPQHTVVQYRAYRVLNNLFILHHSILQKITKNIGVLQLIVNAMEEHPDCEKVQIHGCSVLDEYYNNMDDQESMKTMCPVILAKAMQYESCRKTARELMCLLCTDDGKSENEGDKTLSRSNDSVTK